MITPVLCLILMSVAVPDATVEALGRTWAAVYGVETSYGTDMRDGDQGRSWGPLQIQMCVLEDVNRKYGTHYFSEDRRGLSKSIEIFVRYCLMYEPAGNPERWSRLWNSGPRWRSKRHKTDEYWRKVKSNLN